MENRLKWIQIDTGPRTAKENMELDAALLEDLEHEPFPILHLYDWEEEAATYGYFIKPEAFLQLDGVKKHALDLARRPTGGGIVFHNCDLAFSVLVPASHPDFSTNPLENYAYVNKRVIWAVSKLLDSTPELLPSEPLPADSHCKSFCMAKPTRYDVMIGGRKIGGAAQRKTRHGFLHQGTISIGMLPEEYLREILLPGTQVIEAMKANTFSLLGKKWTKIELQEARSSLKNSLKQAFHEQFQGNP
ncbi:MAG: Octanoyltransferase LipM [Chlamydiae bacterium]|nr:Octanoyltransferase LipM [Chlamydiota bacterium]